MPRIWISACWRGLGLFIVLFGALWAAAAYFPTFAENFSELSGMIPIPVLKEQFDQLERGGVWGYMAGQQFFKGCNTMGVAAAVLFAVGAVAGEFQRGTFEVWLARPVSRNMLLLERWLAGALAVCVPVFLSTYAMNWMLDFSEVNARFGFKLMTLAAGYQCLLLLAIYSATFFFSVIGENPTRISFGMLFFSMAMFSIYLVETITKYSLFRLTDIDRYITLQEKMGIDWSIGLTLIAVSLGFVVLSLWRFSKRVP